MENEDRFWGKVSKRGEDDCWPWLAYRDEAGYGRFWNEGKMKRASRVALLTVSQEPFNGCHALHSCDNPPCCNPRHLKWGTHQENSDDKLAKDRHHKGENHPHSVFTNEIADAILKMKMDGFNCHEVAEGLGLTYGGVMNVFIGRSWTHRHGVDGNPSLEDIKNKRPDRRRPRKVRIHIPLK